MKIKSKNFISTLGIVLILNLAITYLQQGKTDCKKELDKTPYIGRNVFTKSTIASIEKDFIILKNCGNLDSVDIKLLCSPLLISIMNLSDAQPKNITYKVILEHFKAFQKTEEYKRLREAVTAAKILSEKTATTDEFEKHKDLFLKIGVTSSELDSIKVIIQSDTSKGMTFQEVYKKYFRPSVNSTPANIESVKFKPLIDIKSAIKEGKTKKKKVLLYFTGYSVTNARYVEKKILTDVNVKNLMTENFLYFNAYVDDRKIDNVTQSTVGQKFHKILKDNFNRNDIPYFCIIDSDGKILSDIGYTNDTEEFIRFLKNGLK